MRIRICEIVSVFVVAFLAWICVFLFERCLEDREQVTGSVSKGAPFPDDRPDNLFWFLQITDIHLSYLHDNLVSNSLKTFCSDIIRVTKPSLVLVTGDLTHAKFADERRSQQFISEWKSYQDVLSYCNVDGMPWLDIRGNHDDFNVLSIYGDSNYFKKFSVSGKKYGTRSYCYVHHTPFGSYKFIALDACPNPGPKRPYNFFGILDKKELFHLTKLTRKEGNNHTVWFSHYPSAFISTDRHHLSQLLKSSVAYVCGHLHTLGGFVPHMYGKHPSGHLELELADFRHSKRFRLMAFDHDLFSFIDATVGEWPLVLVTNPKTSQFLSPREPSNRMMNSSHIRVLVFSNASIVSVELQVNGQLLPPPIVINDGPLYVSPWNPTDYAFGLHSMQVTAKDVNGQQTVYTQTFSLDGTVLPMDRLPQLLLLTDFHSLLRLGFLFIWLTVLFILLLSWINLSERSYFYHFVRTRSVYYSYVIVFTYFGLGPWYVGEIVDGVYGFVCVHGVFVMGHFIPGSMTYLHAILQVILVYLPLLYYLNRMLSRPSNPCYRSLCHCVIVMCLFIQLLWILTAYPYGYLAILVSPGVTWPVVFTLWAVHKALQKR